MKKLKKTASEQKLQLVKGGKSAPGASKSISFKASEKSEVHEATSSYGSKRLPESGPTVFRVSRGGKQKEYSVSRGYGYFIASFQKASSLQEINALIEHGITSKDIEPIIEYLEFKVPEIAKAASVSASTVSRWEADSFIGVPGSNQFFKIDEVIRKGVDLFGGLDDLKRWLTSPNMAFGNEVPSKMITSPIGVELVDEALDALHFGNVM